MKVVVRTRFGLQRFTVSVTSEQFLHHESLLHILNDSYSRTTFRVLIYDVRTA